MPQPLSGLERAVRESLRGAQRPVVLAVSGGADSMVLLHAAARVARGSVAAVASFDHGSGAAAREAQALVADRATALAFPVVLGAGTGLAMDEDSLRRARWSFLLDVARAHDAVVATAHTEDDHLETIVMRTMRGAGARGLAALLAPAPRIVRPLLGVRRADVRHYAARRAIPYVDDPSNEDPRYVRNRVRRDLLPAMVAARPALEGELLELARRAAALREELDAFVRAHVRVAVGAPGVLQVAASDLSGYDSASLAVLWPVLAARVGLALDRRGTSRLAAFTMKDTAGAVMPLSGGWEVARRRDSFELRRARSLDAAPAAHVRPGGVLHWGRWHFQPRDAVREVEGNSAWSARLPDDRPLTVRAWAPGDRLSLGQGRRRRVKRFLAEAGLEGAERLGWPVVLAGDEVIWIPGVRRSDAATERSGRPGVLYHCDRDDR